MSDRLGSAALAVFASCAACSSSGPGSIRERPAGSSSGGGGASGGISVDGQSATTGATSTGGTGSVALPGGNGGGGTGGGCNDLEVTFEKVVPTVVLLVDRSKSMFNTNSESVREMLWDPLYNALMDPSAGVVKSLENEVRFGFTAFNSVDGDSTCPVLATVAPKLANHADIDMAYTAAGMIPDNYYKWDTPTGEAINQVVSELLADPDPGRKYVLLVTDGNPDTCTQRDPQCGEDVSIDAVQKAYAAGIATFAVGIGDILTSADGGCWGRCGVEHLQDLANAGAGQAVLRNTDQDFINTCTQKDNMGAPIYVAQYVDDPALAGTAPYYTASDPAALQTTLTELIAQVRSCSFEMNALVDLDRADLGTVTIDGTPIPYQDPNGWQMQNEYTVELVGEACQQIQSDDTGGLFISFPCEVKTPRVR